MIAGLVDGSDDTVGTAGLSIQILSFSNSTMSVGEQVTSVPVSGACNGGTYSGTALLKTAASMPPWVVTKVSNGGKATLTAVTLGVVYDSDGTLH
jgi:hypothetical protein